MARNGRAAGGVALLSALLQGCTLGTLVPKDGPTGLEVRSRAEVKLEDPGRLSYAFVKLSPLVAKVLQTEPQPAASFSRLARLAPAADVRVAASDTISLTIFEAAPGGLFIPTEGGSGRQGNFVTIPPQEVDLSGNITIPYAGTIRVLGRSPREIEREIVEKLKSRAIEPQVIAAVGERTSNAVTILGDVKASVPLRPGGLRLLAAIARAGGTTGSGHSTVITVQRRGRSEQALLTSILKDPTQNIQLAPDDVVIVSTEPRIFMAFGAVGGSGSFSISTGSGGGASFSSGRRFSMDRENLTLAEALAMAGGVSSGGADPRSIFLFRYTPRDVLRSAGIDVSNFPGGRVPTVYTVDLSQAEGYLLANSFYMKHDDLIYVAEHPLSDLQKFLNIIGTVVSPITGPTQSVIGTVQAARGL